MTKSRNQSDILNGGQTIFNEVGSAVGLALTCSSDQEEVGFYLQGGLNQTSSSIHISSGASQTGNMLFIDGANGNTFTVNNTGNPIMRGYSEATNVNNIGTFDFTRANFFRCTPLGDIIISPIVGDLEVVSATIHISNTSSFKIDMPINTYWVDGVENLERTGKFIIVLHSFDAGLNWFATFVGELPDEAPF